MGTGELSGEASACARPSPSSHWAMLFSLRISRRSWTCLFGLPPRAPFRHAALDFSAEVADPPRLPIELYHSRSCSLSIMGGTITEAGWVMQYPACLGYGRSGGRHGTTEGRMAQLRMRKRGTAARMGIPVQHAQAAGAPSPLGVTQEFPKPPLESGRLVQLAFPQDKHVPAQAAKRTQVAPVPSGVVQQLLFPEGYVACREP